MCGLEVDQQVFSSLVSYFLPSVYDHLRPLRRGRSRASLSPGFVCLFVEAPLEATRMEEIYQVWDHLFLYGDEFLFAFSLALLQSKEAEIFGEERYRRATGVSFSTPDSRRAVENGNGMGKCECRWPY